MRRLSGEKATDRYTPMDGVRISLTDDGRLTVYAPKICNQLLVTNDLATIYPDNTFTINGRTDNTVCSGGIKLQFESIEQKLQTVFSFPFVLTTVDDDSLGEALTMLYESDMSAEDVKQTCKDILGKYEVPRHFLQVAKVPLTPTGKPSRAAARQLATSLVIVR